MAERWIAPKSGLKPSRKDNQASMGPGGGASVKFKEAPGEDFAAEAGGEGPVFDLGQYWDTLDRAKTSETLRSQDPSYIEKNDYERREAEHYRFPRKIKPGSQYGQGKRKTYTQPPWEINRSVLELLSNVQQGFLPAMQDKRASKSLTQSLKAAVMHEDEEPPCFCRLQNYQLVKTSPLLNDMGKDDLPVHKEAPTIISLCEMGLSDSTLAASIDETGVDVVIGMGVKLNIKELVRSLPKLRSLGLSLNRLNDKNMDEISDWLKGNSRLERLSITQNSVDDTGALSIAKGLAANTRLTSLKLSEGKIKDDGAAAIAEAIVSCPCLSVVDMALKEEHVDLLEVALAHNFPFSSEILHKASQYGSTKSIKYLCETFPEIADKPNENGWTPLMEAVVRGQMGSMAMFSRLKCDRERRDKQDRTLVHLAALHGQNHALRFLLDTWRGSFPKMHKPVKMHFELEAVKSLWDPENEVNESMRLQNEKPASLVAKSSSLFARVENGLSDKDKSANPPLELSFELSCLGQVHESQHILVPQQAATTPLHLRLPFEAMTYGDEAFVEIKISRWDMEGNSSTLGFAQIALSLLLEKHPEVSPQWLQILGGNMRPVGWIKISGRAVFHQVERESFFGTTPLLDAASKGHLDVCETLVANGANIDVTDPDGNTPLINAVWGGHRYVVLMLLRVRSDLAHENRNGVTALTAAERREHLHIIPILQTHSRVARGQPMNIHSWDMEPTPPGTPDKEGNPDSGFDDTPSLDQTASKQGSDAGQDIDQEGNVKTNKVRWREKGKGQLNWLETMFKGEYLDARLDIEVVSAVDLPRADVLGLSDPYCVLNLNGSVFKTSVKKNTLTPVWEESHVFDDQRRGVWAEQALVLEVYDWNRLGKEKLLGRLEMEVLDLEFLQDPGTGGEEWFFLHDENGNQVYGEPPDDVKAEMQRQQKEAKKKKMSKRGSIEDDQSEATSKGKKGKRASLVPVEKGQPSQILLKFRFDEGAGKYVFLHIDRGVSFDLDAKGKPPNLVTWIRATGAHIHSEVSKGTTSPVWGWDARVPARTNDVKIRIEVRLEHEKDPNLPGLLLGMLEITSGQVETMVGGGLSQGWVELQADSGGRVRNQEGSAMMIMLRMGVWTKTTDTHEEDLRILHGPPPEPRPKSKMPDASWAQLQALKLTCEPVGWARAAWERFGSEVFPEDDQSQASLDTAPEYCLTADGVRDLLRELGHELNPEEVADIVEQYSEMEGGENAPRTLSWPDLCELLGFDRDTPVESEEIPEQNVKEIVVNGHCKAKIGQRVVLREDTKQKFPDMAVDSGDGPGTIVYLDHAMDGDEEASHGRVHIEGLTVKVTWDKTNKTFDYRTGFEGQFRLCIYQAESKITVEDLDVFISKHRSSYLKNLDLSFNQISNPGVTALANVLCRNATLERLNLHSNRLSRSGGDELGKLLQQNRALTDLQLGSNRLQDEGLFQICQALRQSDAVLKILGLESNEITSKGARLFAKCFFTAPSLEVLQLGNNALGGDGAQILGEGLRYCRKLRRLELQSNSLGTRGLQMLSIGMRIKPSRAGKPALSGNTTLESLDLRSNNISDPGLEEFAESIKRHKKLEVADLAENPLSPGALEHLRETIHEKNFQLNLEKYAIVLEKIWRGALTRRKSRGQGTKASGGALAWNTLRKHVVEEEDQKPFGLRATGMSPELWAKTVFLREAIPGQGLTIAGLQSVIKELGKNASIEACSNLMTKYVRKEDATMMPWWAFCKMMQIDPNILESYAADAAAAALAQEEEERLSRERDEMFVDPADREEDEGKKNATILKGIKEDEQVPILVMGWGDDGEDEPQRVALLEEGRAIVQKLKALNATGLRERFRDGDDTALEELLMMEARADEIIQEAEYAHLRAVDVHEEELMEASRVPEQLRNARAEEIAAAATDKAARALDRYEELERLLARRDADPDEISRLVAELEDAQSQAVDELSAAEMAANVENLRVTVQDTEARAEQQMIEANLGLEAKAAGMDELSIAFHQLQDVLQRQGEETEEDIDAIEEAWERFEIAQQDAEDAIAQAEEENALLAEQASQEDSGSLSSKKKKRQVRREVSWEDSFQTEISDHPPLPHTDESGEVGGAHI